MAVLERVLIDSWTTETAKAWTELWDTSASAMMKASLDLDLSFDL